jgi:hypothetical protein
MRRWLLRLTVGAVLLLGLASGGLLTFIYSGVYDVAATRQHTAPVYWAHEGDRPALVRQPCERILARQQRGPVRWSP